MTRDRSLLFLLLGILLVVFVYVQKERAKTSYFEQKQALLLFEKEAKELSELKSKHQDKKVGEQFIKSLEKIRPPTKQFEKTDAKVFEYEGLDVTTLDQLIKKIQNSTVEIVKLDILRQSDQAAKLRLEIKK